MDDSTERVTVPSLPQLLTQEEEATLREELASHHEDTFGVEQYVLARSFISRFADVDQQ